MRSGRGFKIWDKFTIVPHSEVRLELLLDFGVECRVIPRGGDFDCISVRFPEHKVGATVRLLDTASACWVAGPSTVGALVQLVAFFFRMASFPAVFLAGGVPGMAAVFRLVPVISAIRTRWPILPGVLAFSG